MKRIAPSHLPKMRVERLIVDDLADEVLVYDLDRHKAHCLNQTAALVWRACDGKTTSVEIGKRLTRKFQTPFNEQLVWLALRQLDRLHLLEQSVPLPPRLVGISRREMIRDLGVAAAVAVPVVTSIISPTAVQASTCLSSGASCSTSSECCSKACVGNTCM